MGLSSSKTKTSSRSNSTTTPNVPNWYAQPTQQLAGQIQGMIGQTATPTPASALQQRAWTQAGNLSTGSATGEAQGATRNLLDYNPDRVSAGQLADADLSKYMDPYQSQVIDALLGDFQQANDLGLNSLRSMTPTGAYGGSRQAVSAGQMVGDNARTLAGTVAGLRSQGFNNAQNAALQDINNRLSADTFNSQQGLAGANLRLNAAGQLGSQALADSANERANLGLLSDLGQQQYEVDQAQNPQNAQMTYIQNLLRLLQGTNPQLFTGQTTNSRSSGTTSSTPSLVDQIGTALQMAGSLGKI